MIMFHPFPPEKPGRDGFIFIGITRMSLILISFLWRLKGCSTSTPTLKDPGNEKLSSWEES
jgi:hypothetical protein